MVEGHTGKFAQYRATWQKLPSQEQSEQTGQAAAHGLLGWYPG